MYSFSYDYIFILFLNVKYLQSSQCIFHKQLSIFSLQKKNMILEEVTSCKKCTCKLMLFPPPPPLPPSTYRSSISTRLDTCAHVYFRRLHMFPKQKSLMFDGVLFKILWITMPYLFEVNRRAKSHHLMISNTLFD